MEYVDYHLDVYIKSMQQIHLMNNNVLLASKLKKKAMQIPTNVIRKGKKRVVRFFHKRKFAGKNYKWRKNFKRTMEKRILSRVCEAGRKNPKKQYTIYIQSTYNNTIYTLSQKGGKTDGCISTGMCGFKNTRKSTSYASQVTAEKVGIVAKKYRKVSVKIKGVGPGKLSGVRTLHRTKLKIQKIWECTALPHNGCRPSKRRRL